MVCELAAAWGVPPWVVWDEMSQEWYEWGLLWLGASRASEAEALKKAFG